MVIPLLIGLLAVAAVVFMMAKRSSPQRGQVAQSSLREDTPTAGRRPTTVPDHLDVKIKQYFFSRSEASFFQMLEQAVPSGYRVFPNVRLNDLFLITAPQQQRQATYARLRDKHVDFLIVALPDHCPVVAIELDGKSHDNATQQHRDAVKDTAFRSAGLPLLRLRAEDKHTKASLEARLQAHLRPTERKAVA